MEKMNKKGSDTGDALHE